MEIKGNILGPVIITVDDLSGGKFLPSIVSECGCARVHKYDGIHLQEKCVR